ncbi:MULTISPECIES: DUF1269 domain-containing protein [unclassified Gordonia (in: high G+C Gram-positive bacteria)]
MTDYVAAISFPEKSTAYEVYNSITNSEVSAEFVSAAIVERDDAGHLTVTEGGDVEAGDAVVGGSLIGMLVGLLGGPLGVLLGFGLGAAGGAVVDAGRSDDHDDAITEFGRSIPAGGNALLAQTDEADTAPLDALVSKYNGTIVRRPLDDVIAELETQEAAAEAAADAARESMRKERKAERKEKREERVAALKSKFSKS